MTGAVRQVRAIALLVLRGWLRQGPHVRLGKAAAPTRGASAILLRMFLVAVAANAGTLPSRSLGLGAEPSAAATWAGFAVSLFVVAIAFATELPAPRMQVTALRSNLLDQMPISPLASLVILLSRTLGWAVPCIALGWSMRAVATPGTGQAQGIALGSALFVVSALFGSCLGQLLKRLLAPFWASRAGWLSTLLSLAAFAMFELSIMPKSTLAPAWGRALGRALMGDAAAEALLSLLVAALLLGWLFTKLQRSAESSEPVAPGTTASSFGSGASMLALERLLNRREPGRFQIATAVVACAGLQLWLLGWLKSDLSANFVRMLIVVINLQLVSMLGAQRATRAVTRDALARPLLGALPITPRDTLAVKVRTAQRGLLAIAATLVLYPAFTLWQGEPLGRLTWLVPMYLLAAAIYAAATVYVAFLTAGLGTTQPRGGAFGSFESLVVVVPFAGVALAPSPWAATLSLATLAALTFEARRAALKSIDWLDDPEGEHGTDVWKALVVFGAFQGAQVLALQVSGVLDSWLSSSARLLAAYTFAAVALWILTVREQEQELPEHRPRLAWLGLLTGLLSGAAAWLYLRFGPHVEAATGVRVEGSGELVLLALAVLGFAPIVEERFFRGWLQPALASALGGRERWAPVIAAVAFAAVHPAYSFVPVLVLGLLNGLLMQRTRSLSACMVSHAVHNILALLLASKG